MTTTLPESVTLGIVPADFFTEFRAHYLAAALTLCDEELGQDASADQLAPEAAERITKDCGDFLRLAFDSELLWTVSEDSTVPVSEPKQAGADFWLTRNGHGAGFWDRPEVYGELEAEQLSELAEQFKQADLYRGDNGLIYQA